MRLPALAAALAIALVIATPAAASERHPAQAELESELICPTCHETLDESDSAIARQMKQFIRGRIAAGDTKSEITAKLVGLFGRRVLAEPPKKGFDLLAWVLPIGGILLGAGALGVGAWRWSRGRDPATGPAEPALDPELERRLDDELARFDV
jgi:cytochrome c-type biogenesis protein CcmH